MSTLLSCWLLQSAPHRTGSLRFNQLVRSTSRVQVTPRALTTTLQPANSSLIHPFLRYHWIHHQTGRPAHATFSRVSPNRWVRRTVGLIAVGALAGLFYTEYEPVHFVAKAIIRSFRAGVAGAVVAVDYKWSLRNKPDPALDPDKLRQQGKIVDPQLENAWLEAKRDYEERKSQVHLRSARRILKCLMASGGIYIKLGQHLSAMTYILPREWTDTMRPLQDQCPESSLEEIDQLFRDDLETSLEELFTEFDPHPLGVASLAQVHRAVLRGTSEQVAVKVQHPYLDEFSKIDMGTVTFIIRIAKDLFPDFQFGWLSDEMNISLPQELDFTREALNATRVQQNFAHVRHCPLVIPQVHWAHRRVMAMEYIAGGRIDDLDYLCQHNINPDQVATELTRIFSEMVFLHGWVHCDPHPGNIMVRPHVGPRTSGYNFDIVLLDHGLYRALSSEFRINYAYMWRALISGNEADIRRYSKLLAGTDLYMIFSCILTGRDWQVIQNDLTQTKTQDELHAVFETVPYLLTEIIDVLATVPRELLLLFKTNDLLRSVDEAIRTKPSPAITVAIMGRYCTKAIYNESMYQLRLQRRHQRGLGWSFIRDWWHIHWAYWKLELPLKLVEWWLNIYSTFSRTFNHLLGFTPRPLVVVAL
ncbi:hypothetical protein IWQ61_002925 [Dispira simplex]|nr:hypothetical protein IWQ61_002925 [Dispira simplex]